MHELYARDTGNKNGYDDRIVGQEAVQDNSIYLSKFC